MAFFNQVTKAAISPPAGKAAAAGTLSQNNVLPNGTYVSFDYESYLEENYLADKMETPTTENTQEEIANYD